MDTTVDLSRRLSPVLLPLEVIEAFPNRVLNVHPSLLPRHGGPGMYGARVHEAVLASGDRESGCTVHLVTERYDEGQVVLQARCPVFAGDTPETLAARILELEHRAYPDAVRRVLTSPSGSPFPRPPLHLDSDASGLDVTLFASPSSADPKTNQSEEGEFEVVR